MKLDQNRRYPYSAIINRPDYSWPNGSKLAVYIGLNIEHFAFGTGLGAQLVPGLGAGPDVLNYSWRDYGNRVGVWRLASLFEKLLKDSVIAVTKLSHMVEQIRKLRMAYRKKTSLSLLLRPQKGLRKKKGGLLKAG